MAVADRPELREIFLSSAKRLEVYFYTSSLAKFLQARVVFEQAGLILRHFVSKDEPKQEDYSLSKELLLERALDEINKSIGSNYLLFIEDTSLRIEALSSAGEDYPGLAVKEWFPVTTFQQLDDELKKRNNDRRAIIKSDIALHIPSLKKPFFSMANHLAKLRTRLRILKDHQHIRG